MQSDIVDSTRISVQYAQDISNISPSTPQLGAQPGVGSTPTCQKLFDTICLNSFEQSFTIELLKGLVLAIILALATWAFNRSLERYKMRQSVSMEFAKKRVEELNKLWSKLYNIESILFRYIQIYNDNKDQLAPLIMGMLDFLKKTPEEFHAQAADKQQEDMSKALNASFRELPNEAYAAMYFIGKRSYNDIMKYHGVLRSIYDETHSVLDILAKNNNSAAGRHRVEKVKRRLDRLRHDMMASVRRGLASI